MTESETVSLELSSEDHIIKEKLAVIVRHDMRHMHFNDSIARAYHQTGKGGISPPITYVSNSSLLKENLLTFLWPSLPLEQDSSSPTSTANILYRFKLLNRCRALSSPSSTPRLSSTYASREQDIDGRLCLLRHRALHEDEPHGDERADRITDVVSAVSEAAERRRHHLKRREQAGHLGLFGTGEVTKLPCRLWGEGGSGQAGHLRLFGTGEVTKFSRRL